jgi:phosphoribosylformimino-5-aminoimidazole carboxamide ribonucleotide (ProFAR) isomerase
VKVFPTLNIRQGFAVPALEEEGLDSPAREPALAFVHRLLDLGVHQLGLVDVDAAHGTGHNRPLISQILKLCRHRDHPVCVQVAGGIRSSDQAQLFVDDGASWLVVGTILHKSPIVVEQLLARFQKHLTAAIDARGGEVHSSGWTTPVGLSAEALARRIQSFGFRRLLFVDLPGGTLPGIPGVDPLPDFDTARLLAEATRLPVFMGGSIRMPAHLEGAARIPGLQGVLVDALLFERERAFLQGHASPCA